MQWIKIFVSGIRTELRHERQALARAFESLRIEQARLDLKYSDERLPRAEITHWIYECDVFVSLVDRIHYGAVDPSTTHSLLEDEFTYAQKLLKPIFICAKRMQGMDRENPEQYEFVERILNLQSAKIYSYEFDDLTLLQVQAADVLHDVLPEWLGVRVTRPLFQAPSRRETFVGREQWIETISRALAPGRTALIQGVGGIGKSELAIKVAHHVRDQFPDGVLWADMRSARPADTLSTWGRAYGGFPFFGRGDLRFEFRPTTIEERRVEELNARAKETQRVLAGKRILVILDGVHDERDNAALIPLLSALGDCAVIITSRTRQLRASKEMTLFALDGISADETWALFARIVGENRLDNQRAVVTEIGRTLDFLPQALTLAAAQLSVRRTMALGALLSILKTERAQLEEIKWGYPTGRGIQAALDTLYTLLSPDDQKFFAALCVLGGDDFDAEAAATVSDTTPYVAARTLEHLAELGLVQLKIYPKRYKQHSILRAFARDKLQDTSTELRMAKHYIALAKEQGPKLHRSEMHQADLILTTELSNILAAQRYAQSRNDRTGWELCRDVVHGAMTYYFNLHQMWSDWISWAHTGIQACQKLQDERNAVTIAGGLGMAYQRKGDWAQAIAFYQNALDLLEKLDNAPGMAAIYLNLGSAQTEKGDWEQAVVSLSRALQLNERLGNLRGAAQARANIGMLYSKHGEKTKARAYWLQALEMFNAVGAQNEVDIVRTWLKALPPERP